MDLVSKKDGIFSKAKWIFSSLSGIMLWTSRLPSPLQIPKECHHFHLRPPPGLKTLIYSQGEVPLQNPSPPSIVVNSHMVSSPAPPSSSSWPSSSTPSSSLLQSLSHSSSWSPVMDDLIGTESGVCMNPYHEEETMLGAVDKEKAVYNCNASKRRQRYEMKKEYPPPIPLVARTGNFPGHMPWVLTRHYSNGRLILKEERVKHHQYFEAYRENGRLILNIVLLDNNIVTCSDAIPKKNIEDVELEDLELIKEEEIDGYSSEETEDDDIVVDEITHDYNEGSIMILGSQHMPNMKTRLDEEHEALCKCSTSTARSRKTSNPNFLRNANTQDHIGCTYLGQYSGSVPLAFHVRRMTPVM